MKLIPLGNDDVINTEFDSNSVSAPSPSDWRKWLSINHSIIHSKWLIIFKKDSGISSIIYDEAVDVALCFGWIDSLPKKRDDQSYYVRFSRRNPKSDLNGFQKLSHLQRITLERTNILKNSKRALSKSIKAIQF